MNEAEAVSARKNIRRIRRKKDGHPLLHGFVIIAGLAFFLYCAASIVLTQAEIAEKRQELDVLAEKAEKLEAENDEYQSILSEEDEREFMERYAIEMLGYAYPNERRFYDTTGN